MTGTPQFERARSNEAKQLREGAILESARTQALERGVRAVTLTDIAAGVGMHKSTMLRYFETREEIFLRLAATEWAQWATEVTAVLSESDSPGHPDSAGPGGSVWSVASDPHQRVAALLASSLVARPLFCDLLAHVPLNLERGVSMIAVKEFKLAAIGAAGAVAATLREVCALDVDQSRDLVATATAMAGALWQMAAPGTELRELYKRDPDLGHAVVDAEPRLTRILTTLLDGYAQRL
ncbi:TetR family transcriptional regulator [Gordonia hydrophobica]|uniref:TetR family transcriptional regulator n=1 Tax=Gordonia hydrophobica TaxID=40516 RepID=A0ABZ2TZW3_9ACTN|nr:TetR family transcriptional regulator [Gordonia hydrophobica]MBM7369261.1 AcrR family transcriptional regulator [Gordonia hydrophobica]